MSIDGFCWFLWANCQDEEINKDEKFQKLKEEVENDYGIFDEKTLKRFEKAVPGQKQIYNLAKNCQNVL